MSNISWGERDAPGEKGGLLQLRQSMDETIERIPTYIDVIKKGQDLCQMLSNDTVMTQVPPRSIKVSSRMNTTRTWVRVSSAPSSP